MLDNDKDLFDNDDVDPVLLNMFQVSFMKPLREKAKTYYQEGHLLERPFLKQFSQHSLDKNSNICV